MREGATAGAVRLERAVGGIRDAVAELRREGRTVGLVPTMGYLHEGHLSLVDRAREASDYVVVSIFVNPTQFAPEEDFEAYPRDLERDMELAGERGANLAFAPSVSEMYPREQTVWVEPGPLSDRLCGLSRPDHFRGVLTVVSKLFNVVRPDLAVFGRKDYQQYVLIRRMSEELNFGVEILGAPIVREPDGLAMSSRNEYLDPDDREAALSLSRALLRVRAAFGQGEEDPERLERLARSVMREAGAEVDYASVVDPETLDAVDRLGGEEVCAVAARVGPARLIDNAPLSGPTSLPGG